LKTVLSLSFSLLFAGILLSSFLSFFYKIKREKKKVTKKKREKENFIKLLFIVSVLFY